MGRWQVFGLAASLFFLFRRIKKRQEKSLKTDVFRQIMVEQLELDPNQTHLRRLSEEWFLCRL